jgi:p-methyltransferase
MMSSLDCVVIGYYETPFDIHEQMVCAKGRDSVEYRMFQRDHLRIDNKAMPYLDAISYFQNNFGSRREHRGHDWYHLGEVSNLAALYLTSFLRRRNFTAEFVSMLPAEEVRLNELLDRGPRAVVITTTFYLIPLPVVSIVDIVRQRCPETTIIVGGPLVYNLVHDLDNETLQGTLNAMGADIYVRESQGEATLVSIMECLRFGGNLKDIANCYINSSSGFEFTKNVPENNPIEECSIDWDSFEDWELGDTVQMRTARSCAFKCSFCDYPLRAGPLSAADVTTVERELRQIARRRVRNVVFIDDTFNVPIGRFRNICEMMIANDFPLSWFSYFRCSNAKDPSVFDLLSHSGCAGVFLGVESADDKVLANMNKRAHGDDYRRGIAEFNKRNIASFASLIVGFPGESQQSITNTINFLNEACPTFYRVEPLWYNVRAPIAKDAERFGLSGSAFRWKHSTMEANTAADGAQRIFEEVRGAAWMPMYMFDFWALPYLMGKGMTLQEVVEFHQHAYRAMRCAIAGENSAAPLNDIARMFSKAELQRSRYRWEPSVLTE